MSAKDASSQSTQLVIPRKFAGYDWSSETVVLAHRGDTYPFFAAPNGNDATEDAVVLAWRRAGKAWEGMLEGYKSFPASLVLLRRTKGSRRTDEVVLATGGRLSGGLLQAHAATIDQVFGATVSRDLHPKHTVNVDSRIKQDRLHRLEVCARVNKIRAQISEAEVELEALYIPPIRSLLRNGDHVGARVLLAEMPDGAPKEAAAALFSHFNVNVD